MKNNSKKGPRSHFFVKNVFLHLASENRLSLRVHFVTDSPKHQTMSASHSVLFCLSTHTVSVTWIVFGDSSWPIMHVNAVKHIEWMLSLPPTRCETNLLFLRVDALIYGWQCACFGSLVADSRENITTFAYGWVGQKTYLVSTRRKMLI